MSSATLPVEQASHGENADRLGVFASVLCAIHCAATPILLLFAPAFGELWSHPASHWVVALFVVPLALVMVLRGFRVHRKRWIVATGLLGMALIIVGAIIPYVPALEKSGVTTPSEIATEKASNDEVFFWAIGEEMPGGEEEVYEWAVGEAMPGEKEDAAANAEGCLDSCCPSLIIDSEGNTTLHVPLASIVTTLGGAALICTHLGNLCACRKRRNSGGCDSPLC